MTSSVPNGVPHPLPRRRIFTALDSQNVYRLAEEKSDLGESVKDALGVIDSALDRFGPAHLALSFNGGKDCTVLIHLFAASLFRHFPSPSPPPQIKGIYVRCTSPFPAVEEFVASSVVNYNLDLEAVEGGMKEALSIYLDRTRESQVKAILVGTRRGDPHGAPLKAFSPTSNGWPDFMRVHPVLDWSYSQIWNFLRDEGTLTLGGEKGIEWCNLYDLGYTSLGSTHNSFPNPCLLVKGGEAEGGIKKYRPAWELEDESKERAGR